MVKVDMCAIAVGNLMQQAKKDNNDTNIKTAVSELLKNNPECAGAVSDILKKKPELLKEIVKENPELDSVEGKSVKKSISRERRKKPQKEVLDLGDLGLKPVNISKYTEDAGKEKGVIPGENGLYAYSQDGTSKSGGKSKKQRKSKKSRKQRKSRKSRK